MNEGATNPRGKTAAEIEHEVDLERGRVAQTIDALQDKISIGGLVDQVVRAMSEHGGDAGRNLGRTVRDNPLPLLLTGVGLAWLMAGSGTRPIAYDVDRWDRPAQLPPTTVPAHYGADTAGLAYAGEVSGRPPANGEDGSGRSVADKARDAKDALAARASNAASGAAASVRGGIDRATDAAGSAAAHVRDRAERSRHHVVHAGHSARQSFDSLLDEQPLVMGALALAVGAAIGGALPRTRTEDELLGERSDRITGGAKQAAQAVVDETKAIASETASKVESRASTPPGASSSAAPAGGRDPVPGEKPATGSPASGVAHPADPKTPGGSV